MLALAEAAIILTVASLLISAALILSQKKPKLANLDDAIGTSATQGAYLPLVIGRQRSGPVVLWVEPEDEALDDSQDAGATASGLGKGAGGVPSQPSYLRKSLHGLAVGPGSSLRAIYQNGEVLWEGYITPATHPSGTPVQCQLEPNSYFNVYWGFPDDPTLPFLQNSKSHGLLVRYPNIFKVLWNSKDLGSSRQWPRLEYEFECPCYSQISTTASVVPPKGDISGPTWDFLLSRGYFQPQPGFRVYTSGTASQVVAQQPDKFPIFPILTYDAADKSIIVYSPDQTTGTIPQWGPTMFRSGGILRVWRLTSGQPNPLPIAFVPSSFSPLAGFASVGQWTYHRIQEARLVQVANFGSAYKLFLGPALDEGSAILPSPPQSPNPVSSALGPISSANVFFPQLVCQVVDTFNSDGVNAIHMVDQLLFARYPYGAARDRSKFDEFSIDQAAEVLERERILGGITVRDGEAVSSVLAALMQDIGLMIALNPETGRYVFRLLRYESAGADLSESLLLKMPEIETIRGDRTVDQVAFTFRDRQRNYREVPIRVDDNGQIAENESVRAQKVPIEVTCDRRSVANIAPRRGQEALGSLSVLKVEVNHAARLAVPGSRVTVSPIEDQSLQFVISDVTRQVDSSKVELGLVLDSYSPEAGQSEATLAGGQDFVPAAATPEVSLPALKAAAVFEMPRMVDGSLSVEFVLLAARSSALVRGARFWVSRDGTTYSELGFAPIAASGVLTADLPADTPAYGHGPVPFADGSLDVNSMEDLTLLPESWRAGRQLLLIGSELIYLQDGFQGELRGLIRGRMGTRPQHHAAGTRFWVILAHRLEPIGNPIFVPGRQIRFKAEAFSQRLYQGLDGLDPILATVEGRAAKPKAPSALRMAEFRTNYPAAADEVDFFWSYHSSDYPWTGFGMQPAGSASGTSDPKGHFLATIEVAGVPVFEAIVDVPAISIPLSVRTDLNLDTGAPWALVVRHVEGSLTSDEARITVHGTP